MMNGMKFSWCVVDVVADVLLMNGSRQISGGTGITPFYQLFNSVISRSSHSPRTHFTLLHSSRTPAELPPVIMLDKLSTFAAENPEKFTVHFFVDSIDGSKTPLPHLQVGRIGKSAIEQCLGLGDRDLSWWTSFYRSPNVTKPLPQKTLFLVCGPEP
jgi:cytochrome-b5 reductase